MKVTDYAQNTASTAPQSLTINPPALTITAPAFNPGTVSSTYSAAPFTGAGGTAPYTYSIYSGSLPAGLALNPSTGVISGTPTAVGVSSFVVQITDAARATSMSAPLSIYTNPATLTITAPALPPGTINVPYGPVQYVASGGNPPYTFSVNSGTLPAGITLNPLTGVLSGTPTVAGTFTFTVQVMDTFYGGIGIKTAQGVGNTATTPPQTLVINYPALTITAPVLTPGTVGTAYTPVTYTGSGGTQPYQYAVNSGSLPPGLTLSPTTGVLSGTPTTAGTYQFVVGLSSVNTTSVQPVSTPQQTLVVNPPPLTITSTPVTSGTVNLQYPATNFTAAGGTPPYSWSVTAGALPPGLTLSGTGVLSGTPTTAGLFNFTVKVTDRGTQSATANLQISIVQPLTITPNIVPPGTVGVVYPPVQFSADGGSSFTFSATGLPPGLTLTSTGLLQGTPTTAGVYTFTVSGSGSYGGFGSATITMRIYPALTIGPITIPPIDPGTPTQITFTVNGGTAPYTYTLSGCTIPGLTLSAAGVLSGTATTGGTYNCVIGVTDSVGAPGTYPSPSRYSHRLPSPRPLCRPACSRLVYQPASPHGYRWQTALYVEPRLRVSARGPGPRSCHRNSQRHPHQPPALSTLSSRLPTRPGPPRPLPCRSLSPGPRRCSPANCRTALLASSTRASP